MDGHPVLLLVIGGEAIAQPIHPLGIGIALRQRQRLLHRLDDPRSRRRAGLTHFEVANHAARRLGRLGPLEDFHGMEWH